MRSVKTDLVVVHDLNDPVPDTNFSSAVAKLVIIF